jgi:hypothetical protein
MATAVVSGEVASHPWRLRLPERLPVLKGKCLTAYAALWAVLLAVAVLAPVRGAFVQYYWNSHPSWSPYGLIVYETDSAIRVAGVFGTEARRAGIARGDSVTAINGAPVTSMAVADVVSLITGVDGKTVTMRLRSPSGRQRDVRLARNRSTADELFRAAGISRAVLSITFLSGTIIPFVLVPAAILLFVRRRREIIPCLLSVAFLTMSGWMFEGAIGLQDAGVPEALRILMADVGWSALLVAVVAFPEGRLSSRWAIAAIAVMPLCFANDFIFKSPWGLAFGGAAALLAGVAIITNYRAVTSVTERQQYRWAFFGFVAGISILLLTMPFSIAGQDLVGRDPRWFVWLNIFVDPGVWVSLAVMALGLMVSILRYRLYDADAVIGRSAAYGVLTLGFVALFAGTEKLAELIGERYFEHSIGIVAGAVGAAVAAAVVVPLHNRVHRWAERRFQKPLIRLREGLPECVSDLRESAPVEQLVWAVMNRLKAGVRSTREAVLLTDNGKLALAGTRGVTADEVERWTPAWKPPETDLTLDCDRHDPTFPLRVRLWIESTGEPETIGWLLLGPRPDGSFFGRDEREALAHVAAPIARAIHIAQLRERREEQAEKRIGALEALVSAFVGKLASGSAGEAAPA